LLADGFSHVGAFESLSKNMCESVNLVHQKGDPYRTKGIELTYCQIAVFQAFGGAKKRSSFGPKLAVAEALLGPMHKSRAAAVRKVESVD
jgi:hypothetical protein